MDRYFAQCRHQVNRDADICPVCGKRIERIWNLDELGNDNMFKLIDSWKTNRKPQEIYEKAVLPYERDEYIYRMCAAWDDSNPGADESTRMNAFKQIIENVYLAEYERCCDDIKYYEEIKNIHFRDKDYVHV